MRRTAWRRRRAKTKTGRVDDGAARFSLAGRRPEPGGPGLAVPVGRFYAFFR